MIKVVIFSVCLAWVFVEVLKIGKVLTIKPYKCELCMAGWFGLYLFYLSKFPASQVYVDAVGIMAVSMVCMVLLNGINNNL